MSLEDVRVSSEEPSVQASKNGTLKEGPTTEVTTGNNPGTSRQAEAEVKKVQME